MGVNVVPLDRMCPQNEYCKSADVFLFFLMKRNADVKMDMWLRIKSD